MLGDDPKAKEEFEALAKAEMEVWKSIMSGAAIMEHMEDKYHDMLKVRPALNLVLRNTNEQREI